MCTEFIHRETEILRLQRLDGESEILAECLQEPHERANWNPEGRETSRCPGGCRSVFSYSRFPPCGKEGTKEWDLTGVLIKKKSHVAFWGATTVRGLLNCSLDVVISSYWRTIILFT